MKSGRPMVQAGLALMLVLLAAAVIRLVAGEGAPEVRLAAAGPTPTPSAEVAGAGAGETAPAETTTTTSTEDRPRVEAVHGRTSPPQPAGSVLPADEVVRTSTSVRSGSSSSPVAPPPSGTPLPTVPTGAACPASEVRVTVITDQATYAAGETVRGSTTIENRSATACLLPTRGFVRILNAAGKDVSGFAYTTDYRFPVSAEPGKKFSTPFTWDQKDCSGSACVQVPAGTYTVVADWTEGGPYTGRGSFTIGG